MKKRAEERHPPHAKLADQQGDHSGQRLAHLGPQGFPLGLFPENASK
jgi:hypothetical protein